MNAYEVYLGEYELGTFGLPDDHFFLKDYDNNKFILIRNADNRLYYVSDNINLDHDFGLGWFRIWTFDYEFWDTYYVCPTKEDAILLRLKL